MKKSNTLYIVLFFWDKFYQLKDRCAMTKAYMEFFEKRDLDSAPHPPRIRKRYVDDTFCVSISVYQYTEHINTQARNIKFTREEEEDGALLFLATVINRLSDGSVKIKIFRKPTPTNIYIYGLITNFSTN